MQCNTNYRIGRIQRRCSVLWDMMSAALHPCEMWRASLLLLKHWNGLNVNVEVRTARNVREKQIMVTSCPPWKLRISALQLRDIGQEQVWRYSAQRNRQLHILVWLLACCGLELLVSHCRRVRRFNYSAQVRKQKECWCRDQSPDFLSSMWSCEWRGTTAAAARGIAQWASYKQRRERVVI